MDNATLPPLPAGPRLLIRGANWLGDAVMSTPALLRLREAYPRSAITLLSPAKLADLWTGHSAVDHVLTFSPGEGVLSVAKRLRAGRFHFGLVLPNSFRSAAELWCAGIPRRVGYPTQLRRWLLNDPAPPRADAVRMRKRTTGEIRRMVETHSRPSLGSVHSSLWPALSPQAHHVYQYLHLASWLGANPAPLAPALCIDGTEVDALAVRWDLPRDARRPLCAINPGAEYGPAKRWPTERFVATARGIQNQVQCAWIVLGGPQDVDLAEQVAAGITEGRRAQETGVYNLAGKTSLRELCAVLKNCQVLLTNDTGPMHLAAALGVPVVVPFGSTSPELTGPGLPGLNGHFVLRAQVPCAPCFRRECPIDFRCMRGISETAVVQAILTVLNRESVTRPLQPPLPSDGLSAR